MTQSRWWTVAVAATVVILSVLVLLEQPPLYRIAGAIASIVVLALVWTIFGKRALADPTRYGIGLALAIIALASSAVYFNSSMATFQCIVYPIIWTITCPLRTTVVINAIAGVAIGTAMYFGLGATLSALAVAGTVESLSLIFSIALGLWISTIADQSEERKRLIDELEAAQAQLKSLSRDAGASDERERLAREIHDTIAQDLTGLVLTAQRGLRELRAGNTAATEKQLAILEENARNALTETRALVTSGAAVGVDGGGLAIALRRLGERFERETGIVVSVSADESASLERDAEVVLLRCAQEALANVRKHSTAGTAALTLTAHEGEIDLRISDDGAGFDPAKPSSGFGITGLRERLALVRGTLDVTATPGGGTTLVATLPRATELIA